MAIEYFVLYLLNNMSNKSILILCKLSNNKQPVHMFSTVCSFSCCSWLWANKWIDVSTVWLCIYTEGPHQGTLYVCVTGPQLGMKTSIVCAHAVNACKKNPGRCQLCFISGYIQNMNSQRNRHTHILIHTHTFGVTECTGWAQMNQRQPGEGGMCMALVQERPSESSAGNPGCLSEHKCVCGSVCVCTRGWLG